MANETLRLLKAKEEKVSPSLFESLFEISIEMAYSLMLHQIISGKEGELQRRKDTGSHMHLSRNAYQLTLICMYEMTLHMAT